MSDVTTLRARLRELCVRLKVQPRGDGPPRLRVVAPPGVLTAELRAALAAHKDELLAAPAKARADPPADRSWRRSIGFWPIDWRGRWARRTADLEGQGERWDRAEWQAFLETAHAMAAAEGRGEVPAWSYPVASAGDGLSDAEAVALIDLAFASPPARSHARYASIRSRIPP